MPDISLAPRKVTDPALQRPRHLRQPIYSTELVEAVFKLKEEYPHRERAKLVVLLHDEDYQISTSIVTLSDLTGLIPRNSMR